MTGYLYSIASYGTSLAGSALSIAGSALSYTASLAGSAMYKGVSLTGAGLQYAFPETSERVTTAAHNWAEIARGIPSLVCEDTATLKKETLSMLGLHTEFSVGADEAGKTLVEILGKHLNLECPQQQLELKVLIPKFLERGLLRIANFENPSYNTSIPEGTFIILKRDETLKEFEKELICNDEEISAIDFLRKATGESFEYLDLAIEKNCYSIDGAPLTKDTVLKRGQKVIFKDNLVDQFKILKEQRYKTLTKHVKLLAIAILTHGTINNTQEYRKLISVVQRSNKYHISILQAYMDVFTPIESSALGRLLFRIQHALKYFFFANFMASSFIERVAKRIGEKIEEKFINERFSHFSSLLDAENSILKEHKKALTESLPSSEIDPITKDKLLDPILLFQKTEMEEFLKEIIDECIPPLTVNHIFKLFLTVPKWESLSVGKKILIAIRKLPLYILTLLLYVPLYIPLWIFSKLYNYLIKKNIKEISISSISITLDYAKEKITKDVNYRNAIFSKILDLLEQQEGQPISISQEEEIQISQALHDSEETIRKSIDLMLEHLPLIPLKDHKELAAYQSESRDSLSMQILQLIDDFTPTNYAPFEQIPQYIFSQILATPSILSQNMMEKMLFRTFDTIAQSVFETDYSSYDEEILLAPISKENLLQQISEIENPSPNLAIILKRLETEISREKLLLPALNQLLDEFKLFLSLNSGSQKLYMLERAVAAYTYQLNVLDHHNVESTLKKRLYDLIYRNTERKLESYVKPYVPTFVYEVISTQIPAQVTKRAVKYYVRGALELPFDYTFYAGLFQALRKIIVPPSSPLERSTWIHKFVTLFSSS